MSLERINLGFYTQPDTCPDCGAVSTATKTITDGVDKPWRRHRCEACGLKITAERDGRDVQAAQEASDVRVRSALNALDIPPLYTAATLDSFELSDDAVQRSKQARVLQLARRYVGTWPDVQLIAVFLGCPGSGKGHVVWSVARTLVTKFEAKARVCVLSDVIRDLRAAWGGGEEGGLSEAQRLAKYRAADLLVIDEVSRHAFYGQPQQHLYDLVAWRELRLKPTILTTNETGADLAEFLGPALSSRALGWGVPWDFGTIDYRLTRGMWRPSSLRLHDDAVRGKAV